MKAKLNIFVNSTIVKIAISNTLKMFHVKEIR